MSIAIDGSWALIFGGCCSNVFALEAILKYEADTGLLITVVQFLVVALSAFPSQIEKYQAIEAERPRAKFSNGSAHAYDEPLSPTFTYTTTRRRWKRPALPLHRLLSVSVMFFAVNMLNNWAFAFDISVPMHIILRSFGSVTTLAIGWLYGKRYSTVQVLSVVALTVGVVISAWADASAKGKATSFSLTAPASPAASHFLPGLLILFAAQLISAFMGVYTEATYAAHGRHWTTTLFYTHAFSLALSLLFYPVLAHQASRLLAGPPALLPASLAFLFAPAARLPALAKSLPKSLTSYQPPQALLLLALNAATQVICIAGVNRLSSTTTAVAVTVVLNVRKLASFLLSCLVFGNTVTPALAVGAAVVFGSGAVYGWDSSRKRSSPEMHRRHKRAATGPSGHAVGKAE